VSGDGLSGPELLAPAGDERALRAALAAGADAVYLGLPSFSARAFAGNFTEAKLLEAIDRAHLYGARVHLALNVQLKQDELETALKTLRAPYEAGLDALIVADLGFAAHVRAAFPQLALHASTQLNTHSSAQLGALARLGFRRAVLARELSLTEIDALDAHGLELETFVHGALCYGYSGACLFASMVGGRSGNRGRCAQACRMRYTLRRAVGRRGEVASGPGDVTGRVLSASDLAALEVLPQLVAAGVRAFKIEGRMKDAAYVATATAVYREALQAAVADPRGYRVRSEWLARLEQSYSRGFTTAHLEGRHAEIRSRDRGGHRGVPVGRVETVDDREGLVLVRLSRPVAAGDVLTIFTPWGQTEPLRVSPSAMPGPTPPTGGPAGRLTLKVRERVAVKDRVFRLSAAGVDTFAEDAVASRSVARPVEFHAELVAVTGEPAHLQVRAEGEDVEVDSDLPLEAAATAHLNAGRARDAVGALGGTPYRLAHFGARIEGDPFLPVGALKELRRRALAELNARRLARLRRPAPVSMALPPTGHPHPRVRPTDMPVVLRLRPGEEPILVPHLAALTLDVRPSVSAEGIARAARRLTACGLPLRCRPPEVLFDVDLGWWRAVAALPWSAVYARSLTHVDADAVRGAAGWGAANGPSTILEYPLQGLNAEAARLLGPAAVVASPEVSLEEIAALVAAAETLDPAASVEVLAFGREQLLVTRDVLGHAEGLVADGEEVRLELSDAKGFVFPVETSPEGSRIFNARVSNLASVLPDLLEAGVGAAIVVQADMTPTERAAFAAEGLPGLAAFAGRDRSTTGHLFRGVA